MRYVFELPAISFTYRSLFSVMFVGLPEEVVLRVPIVNAVPIFIVPQEDNILKVQEVAFTTQEV